MAELVFHNGGPTVDMSDCEARDYNGKSPDPEKPGKLLDGKMDTKWLELNVEVRSESILYITCKENKKFTDFTYVTGDDEPGRDPLQWLLEGGDDTKGQHNIVYHVLHDQKEDAAAPLARMTALNAFQIHEGSGVFKATSASRRAGRV